MVLTNKKINFLGDSITEGVGTSAPENIYLNVIKAECNLAEARNYGISCTRIARQADEFEYGHPFCDRYKSMDDDADSIVIFGGTNDYGHGTAPIGAFEDRSEDTYYGAWHVLLRGLMEKYPRATIVAMTPLHRHDEDTPSPGNGKPLKTYRGIIKEVCEYYAVPVLDLYAMSGIQPRVPILPRNIYARRSASQRSGEQTDCKPSHWIFEGALTSFVEEELYGTQE